MLKLKRIGLFSTTAQITLVVFVVSLLVQPFLAAPARAAGEASATHSIAVVDFQNSATKGGAALASAATNSTILGLIEAPGFAVISGEKVRQAIASKSLQPPFHISDLLAIGQAADAEWVMGGDVTTTAVVEDKVTVELETNIYDVASGVLVVRSRTLGSAPRNGNGVDAWTEAARRAGAQAVRQLQEALGMQGIVLSKPKEGHVRINLGVKQMLRPGAQVIVLDKGKKVASGTVVTSDIEDALVKIDPPQAAASLDVGNDVRVVYNPPKNLASDNTEPEKRKKSEKSSGGNFVLAILVLAAAAALLGGHGGGGGSGSAVPPGTTIGPPTSLVLAPTATNIRGWDIIGASTTIRANVTDVNGRPVGDGTPVTFTTEPLKAQISPGVATTVGGTATATLTSNGPKGTLPVGSASGICTVTAKVTGAGGAVITKAGVIILSGPPITPVIAPPAPPGSKGGTTVIVATITDENGNAVAPGQTVTFSTGPQFSLSPPIRTTDGISKVFTSTLSNPPSGNPPAVFAGTAVVTVHIDGAPADATSPAIVFAP